MNRAERRARASLSRSLQSTRPSTLTRLNDLEVVEKWGTRQGEPPTEVWMSREFLVQVYVTQAREGQLPACRLSVNRTTAGTDGRWDDMISWDELQRVKREVGRGDSFAVEVYPRDRDVVNVANMRHLWIFDRPLEVGWFSGRE